MIVCSCNVLSDHDVRNAVSGSGSLAAKCQAALWLPWSAAPNAVVARQPSSTIIEEALGLLRQGVAVPAARTIGARTRARWLRAPAISDGDGSAIAAIPGKFASL